jgi:Cu(I)/Ag(I) efflux system membrane protein CusA/SilA
MWSTSAGAEVMKPLATPVLGGMVSSLLHVLIVTPAIFYSLRARELNREAKRQAIERDQRRANGDGAEISREDSALEEIPR